MGEFYTVPDAITFRNVNALGNNQSRTLLLKNNSCTEVVVFLSLPFTEYFSLEWSQDSSIQHEQLNNATCVITKVSGGSSGKVVVKLHIPPDSQNAKNLHDCLVVVMGKVPLLVPLRAVWQPLDPASGQCLQAILSQIDFYPSQGEIDKQCNAFVVELASRLQIGLQPPCAQSQPSQHRSSDGQARSDGHAQSDGQAHTHKEEGLIDGRPLRLSGSGAGHPPARQQPEVAMGASMQSVSKGNGSSAAGQQLKGLPPDTFSQASPEHASGPASSGDELRTPVEEGTDLSMMPIPKLDHRITIKGRTAYATRIPGTFSPAPLQQSSQPPSPSLPANAPPAHRNSPNNLQIALASTSSPANAPQDNCNPDLQTAPPATSLPTGAPPAHRNPSLHPTLPSTLPTADAMVGHSFRTSAPSPHKAQALSVPDGAQHASKDHTSKAETAVRAGPSRHSSSNSSSSSSSSSSRSSGSSCKAAPAGHGAAALHALGSIEAAAAAAAATSNRSSSSSNLGRVLRGGSMQAQGPVFLLDGRWFNARGEEVGAPDGGPAAAACSMPLSLQPSAPLQGVAPLLSHLPRHSTPHERPAALASAMRELGVHHLAPAPASISSTSTPFSINSSSTAIQPSNQHHTMAGCLTQLDLPRLPPSALPRRSTSLTRSSSNSLHDVRSSTGKKQGGAGASPNKREATRVGPGVLESNKGRKSKDRLDDDDVERGLESALEAHITQLTDVGKGNGDCAQSCFSSGAGFPHAAQHTQSGVNSQSIRSVSVGSRHASSGSGSCMASSGKKPPAAVAHAKPNSQQPGRRAPPASFPAPSHSCSSSSNGSTRTAHKDGANKSGPASAPVGSTSSTNTASVTGGSHQNSQHRSGLADMEGTGLNIRMGGAGQQQPNETAAKHGGREESEEDDGDGFAEKLAQAIEVEIHAQAAHAAPPRPPLRMRRGNASGEFHAAVKGGSHQMAPPRLGIPASHHTAAKGAMERVRQQRNT